MQLEEGTKENTHVQNALFPYYSLALPLRAYLTFRMNVQNILRTSFLLVDQLQMPWMYLAYFYYSNKAIFQMQLLFICLLCLLFLRLSAHVQGLWFLSSWFLITLPFYEYRSLSCLMLFIIWAWGENSRLITQICRDEGVHFVTRFVIRANLYT